MAIRDDTASSFVLKREPDGVLKGHFRDCVAQKFLEPGNFYSHCQPFTPEQYVRDQSVLRGHLSAE